MRRPELLIPASSLEVLKTAVTAQMQYILVARHLDCVRKQKIFLWKK
jgi:collagenase-like PrtC family protease